MITTLYSNGLNKDATVPYIQGRVPPVDATVTSPEKAYAEPSQTPRPVAIPRNAELIAASLVCLRQIMVKISGITPGHVRIPVESR